MTLHFNLATIENMSKRSLPLLALALFFLTNTLSAEANTTVILMHDDRYEPPDVNITVSDTIEFQNVGTESRWPATNIHPTHRGYPNSDIEDCAQEDTSLMFDACRNIEPGQSYSFTFLEPGAWRYHDHLMPSISGTITLHDAPETEVDDEGSWLIKMWNKLKTFFTHFFEKSTQTQTGEVHQSEEALRETVVLDIAVDDSSIFTDHDALYAYIKKFGAEQSLTQLQAITGSQVTCHDAAHIVGRYAYELSGTEAFSHCSMLCQSGCYHGAVEAYFREHGTTDLANSMNTLCADITNSFILHQCHHGIGHGLMAWSNYELFAALEGCDLITDNAAQRSCFTGVFMENYGQSMANFIGIPGHTTEYLSEDPHFPCNIVAAKYQADCYFSQTDQMMKLAKYDVATVEENCNELSDTFLRSMCFRSLGRTIAGIYHDVPKDTYQACWIVSNVDDRENCLTGVIDNSFWDKTGATEARVLCETMLLPKEKNLCYGKIFNAALMVMDNLDEQLAFCETIDTAYRGQCVLAIQSEQPGSIGYEFRIFR